MKKAKIITQSVLDKKQAIEDALKDKNCIGVFHCSKRRSGNQFLQNLIFNTDDAEIIEPKQLTDNENK
jgi:hypothetical protein